MAEPMQLWDYKVIHLNVESGKGDGSPPSAPPPPFTQSYLEQEFPEHYSHPQPTGGGSGGANKPAPPPAQHPAVQLQGFMNNLGGQGWLLVGIFPLGPMLMMVLRRRRADPGGAALQEPDDQAAVETRAAPGPDRRGPSGGEDLQDLRKRLEALEQRLPMTEPGMPQARLGPNDGSVLPQAALEALAQEPSLSGREAAEAIGYRSPASLANLGNRSGYPIGLVKLGVNGKAAIYRGVTPARAGGKPQRQWVVVPLSRLPGPG